MSWDNTTKAYKSTSQEEREQALIDRWNLQTGANITIDNYAGTGLQAVFYTFIQSLGTLESDVLVLQSNISNALKELNQKVLRPPVVLDRCKALIEELKLNVTVFDTNFSKLSAQPSGYYLVSKGAVIDLYSLEELFKKTVVAGVRTYGSTTLHTTLSNGEPIVYNYTVATQLANVKIKIKFTRINKVEPFETFSSNIKVALAEKYFVNFTVANDINPVEILDFIKNLTTAVAYAEVFYSLDGGTTFTSGYYSIPYDKYIVIAISDIVIEEV